MQKIFELSEELLESRELCPRKCRVNRLAGEVGVCRIGSEAPSMLSRTTRFLVARGSLLCTLMALLSLFYSTLIRRQNFVERGPRHPAKPARLFQILDQGALSLRGDDEYSPFQG